jgi:hypothetical protein
VGQIANLRPIVNRPAQRWLPTTAQDIIPMSLGLRARLMQRSFRVCLGLGSKYKLKELCFEHELLRYFTGASVISKDGAGMVFPRVEPKAWLRFPARDLQCRRCCLADDLATFGGKPESGGGCTVPGSGGRRGFADGLQTMDGGEGFCCDRQLLSGTPAITRRYSQGSKRSAW